ncbi:MAG: heme-binding domain-containing protein [Planctomycetota bacterium]|nr:MAG: heme-binding domain-containing protein [Planctomycetota bacterium]
MIDIGPGSPVGVEFGYGTKFPAKYQKALYICDWTFGTMYALHIEPSGSSYKATKEEFVSRTPLPLTDCTVGKDGALYFTIGGRGAQSELFRVTYVGKEDTKPVDATDSTHETNRAFRKRIEEFHGNNVGSRPSSLLNALGSADRHIRYAARVAVEYIPVERWIGFMGNDLPPSSPDMPPMTSREDFLMQCCVALARQVDPFANRTAFPIIIAALDQIEFDDLSDRQKLDLLRAYQLAFIRLGNPDKDTSAALAKKFDDLFPQKSDFVNRELSILMIHFQSPGAIKKLVPLLAWRTRLASDSDAGRVGHELLSRNKGYGGTIAAMLANQPDQQQYHYAFHLRNLKTGWTLDDRKTYFAWFEKARTWSGGASYPKFLINIDKDAFANCTDTERLAIEASGVRKPYVIPELPKAKGPGKDYTVDEVLALATDKLKGRDFKNGEKMYKAARCVVCHRFGGDGGATGPDLTQLAGRFNLKDLNDAIVDPSKVISDQFKASVVETKSGKVITGQIVSESKDTITILVDPENATKTVEIKKSDIETNQPSKVSLMPKDLLKTLNEDEVRDLLAYLLSRGNPADAMFRK